MPSPDPTMAFFRPDLARPGVRAGLASAGGIVGLARALTASPAWRDLDGAVIVVREAPEPLIAVAGRFDEASLIRLAALSWQIEQVLPRTMVLDYAAVEDAVERLASGLVRRFGRDACASMRYAALPRGGFVVLGLLAYALGLDQSRLEAGDDAAALVVVDDCIVSGNRLRRFLAAARPTRPIVAAALFAAPELRAAAERDARVRAVVSAFDLRDDAERRQGAGYGAWLERWRGRERDDYWIGQPQHVVFPWNEPDIAFWNAASGRTERLWRLVAPERCAKNRASVGEAPAEVQRQAPGSGAWRPAPTLLSARVGGSLVLGAPDWQGCIALDGTAASMWEALVEHGSPDAAVAALAAVFDAAPDQLRADLDGFAAALVERGALEVVP